MHGLRLEAVGCAVNLLSQAMSRYLYAAFIGHGMAESYCRDMEGVVQGGLGGSNQLCPWGTAKSGYSSGANLI